MLMENRTAIVTGGAAGIGWAVAERLAGEGAAVVIADVDATRGKESSEKIRNQGGKAWYFETDISDPASLDALVEFSARTLGKIDVLVNNAGVTRRIEILDLSVEEWDWIQNINTRGMFFCLQRVARHMKETGGGRIINMSSISGKGFKGASNASYAVSKAAAIAVARVAAVELGKHNITVNAVCPGLTATDLLRRLTAAHPERQAELAAGTALGKTNEPADIADAVLFLASDMARNITGQSLNVDCGLVWD
ncbi:SDR family NAD(P)-dependent oxidoreductase [Paraburkholderia sp.]|uniref:SDR family NAD(P)-dependent oxidoreductase n=1 Tax=Paraburkholderia sp. TaxID=1926495 RepID=UPI0039E43351